ncbi:recombinase family protein [Phenylobacterium sp.]|uniref:recombinase family protein n=1 Tax=Phenylobacterium sp. TaxID=1871053 RepID=UPI0011F764B0|nr:recombinase family protein [Phenylobacterium sp.]THD64441.1 MAG: recombinase family protein [Phenylobacterium sp.]
MVGAPAHVRPQRLRCAIYTRKSSEEGLDQSFNSLHAQREACEAYVLSQAGEGWSASKRPYDDGGFSGGSMDRPGLKSLLADIDRGLVDVVVVYKVDRLTRSLADFAKIVEAFDARGVSFVSVTQAFNTTTSMGRLTLNVLLSFAQFEREVTGERIRDKIAASKAKGMWMGGCLPLGYDVKDRQLVVNTDEAERVRHIFQRYLELGSVDELKTELDRDGRRSKSWTTRKGRVIGGHSFSRGALFHLLRNQTYVGRIPHKETSHPGLHSAIIDEATFHAVQQRLSDNAVARTSRSTRAGASPLRGRIFDASGGPMTPTFTYAKRNRVYRYYVSSGPRAGDADPQPNLHRVAAKPIEALLRDRIQRILDAASRDPLDHVIRVEMLSAALKVVVSGAIGEIDFRRAQLPRGDRLDPNDEHADEWVLRIAVRPVFRGGRTWMVSPSGSTVGAPARPDAAMVKALRLAHTWQLKHNAAPTTHVDALRSARAAADSYIRRLTPLAFLAPDIQRAIILGTQPAGLVLQQLINMKIPLAWVDQRRALGFDDGPSIRG